MKPFSFLTALAIASSLVSTAAADTLKINGSTTVNLVVAEAAEILRAENKLDIQVDTQGGSAGGISMLGDGLVQLGMISKHVNEDDKAKYPKVNFVENTIGVDSVAIIVSKDVWDNGVKALSKQQLKDIYEGKVTNWNQVGGTKSQRIAFFNKEPGRGTWEVFVHWVYGGPKLAPQVSFPEVGGNEETRNKVAGTRGAISQLSASWADGKKVFALAMVLEDGKTVDSSNAHIANKTYPLSRPLTVLSNGPATGSAKVMLDFLLSDRGQALLPKHGYMSLKDVGGQKY
ncbi:phosphate ABC transporter substrate-binding protein [Verrucomicrobium sp. BvORR106]|uniref:phosphate ABC transporter substrate-binding protein n=1 Tax=Verrucomicrobium sp. BvORR106 TaxID=1403819 RepID=UPI0022410353|nr:phosphate ABC transporter substrate-binding protein [Verrucomicrobium sp. BvORR106]